MEVIQKTFEPFASMWRFSAEFMRALPEWMDGPFPEIDAELVASECDKWWRGTAKLLKTMTGGPLEVVNQVHSCGSGQSGAAFSDRVAPPRPSLFRHASPSILLPPPLLRSEPSSKTSRSTSL